MLATTESVATFGKGLHGSVRLSVPTGFGHMVMSSWLIEFKRSYPDISPDLLFDNRIDDLLREEVDVAVRVMSEPPRQMVAIELAQIRYVTCASVEYAREHAMPSRLTDISACVMLLLQPIS
ncbi:LysR substrate-binding domain-containing protein [Burkholderia sp. GS2Y]|uniref:LysR substrate-binding domain-containing protein n=1 Tax=Burkholderia theae TaxID=3143496 RepID=A0ABU9WRW1_9BURK